MKGDRATEVLGGHREEVCFSCRHCFQLPIQQQRLHLGKVHASQRW